MRKLLILLVLSTSVFASIGITLSGNGNVKLTKDAVTKLFASSTPTCLKDGARVLSGNKAYVDAYGNDKTPCRKNFVQVVKVKDLDVNTQKQVLGYK